MIAKDCYNAYIDIQFIYLIILNLHDSKVQRFLQRIYCYPVSVDHPWANGEIELLVNGYQMF